MSITFVGLTRFSLVTPDSLTWFESTRHLTLEEAKLRVFDKDRLMLRLEIFRRYALPTYAALTRHPRSHALVIINADLPSFCQKRLREMIAPYPNIRIVQIKEGHSFKMAPKRVSVELAAGGRLFSYRFDDDDALPPSYIEMIGAHADNLPDGTVISPVNGWTIAPAAEEVVQLQKSELPFLALGLGVVSSAERYLSAFQLGNHMTVDKRFPVHLISSERPLWLRTRHGSNDTIKRRRGPPPVDLPMLEASIELKKDFPFINLASMRVLYRQVAPAAAAAEAVPPAEAAVPAEAVASVEAAAPAEAVTPAEAVAQVEAPPAAADAVHPPVAPRFRIGPSRPAFEGATP
ncbi:glycosyltransferase [Ancylobacter oerskovii]|uniref:Glycosyltransferase n=1 Tax=Ancylobacter oerskovii TaxID=459519 RepID=A0ABW4Z4M5_9HYPH|nr:glycosyltransferase [Ancylobacter oerskovii]MBS7545771.1 hypothetical protein [Ancylobacter oerskovii]